MSILFYFIPLFYCTGHDVQYKFELKEVTADILVFFLIIKEVLLTA